MRSMATEAGGGDACNVTHGKELYELEVGSSQGEPKIGLDLKLAELFLFVKRVQFFMHS